MSESVEQKIKNKTDAVAVRSAYQPNFPHIQGHTVHTLNIPKVARDRYTAQDDIIATMTHSEEDEEVSKSANRKLAQTPQLIKYNR